MGIGANSIGMTGMDGAMIEMDELTLWIRKRQRWNDVAGIHNSLGGRGWLDHIFD